MKRKILFSIIVACMLLFAKQSSAQWQLTGNAGTNPATEFLGTTDSSPLIFKISGIQSGKLSSPLTSFGLNSGLSITTAISNSFYGISSGRFTTTGGSNCFFGASSGEQNTTGTSNNYFGNSAGLSNTSGTNNCFFGNGAGQNNTSSNNSFFGHVSGSSNTTGNFNAFFGLSSGLVNTTGNNNAFFGANAGKANDVGFENAFFGFLSGQLNTNGVFNSFFGSRAGNSNTTGQSNTFIGFNANCSVGNLVNATAIGADAIVSASNSIVLGNGANVGIGVSVPLDKLHVVGNIRIVDGNQAAGKVLISDINGKATWQIPPPSTPIGAANGDLNGTYPNPNVDGLQGVAVSAITPTTGQVLQFSGTSWAPAALPTSLPPNGTANGDLNGTYPNPSVDGLQGVAVSATAPTTGQVLQFSGTSWAPAALPTSLPPNGTANGDLNGTYPNPSVDGLQGVAVSAITPTTGQVLQFNGISWTPTALPVATSDWKTTGNAGTNATTDFVGTTDNVSLNFRVNNTRSGRIENGTAKNIMLGFNAGNGSMTGVDNSIYGANAGTANSLGQGNSMFGSGAGTATTTGSNNCFFGVSSGGANTTGINNCFIGAASGIATTGNSNTFLGKNTGFANTTGTGNIYIGFNAGDFNDANTSCTYIGFDADQNVTTDFTNSTSLGNASRVTASNQVRIGNSSVTSIGGFANWTNVSDGRFKKDVKEEVPGMEFINKLRPVTYHLNVKAINNFLKVENADAQSVEARSKELQTGFIAQEVEAAAKEVGYNFSGVDAPKSNDDFYGLRYAEFVVPVVKGMQELSKENQRLKSENQELKSRLEKIEALLSMPSSEKQASGFQKLVLESNGKVAVLGQNIPNPFNGKTIINYYLPQEVKSAQLVITTVNGLKLVTEQITNRGQGVLELDATKLASGNYYYTLITDDNKIDTKQFSLRK